MKKVVSIYNKIMSAFGIICLSGFIISVLVQVFSRTFLPKTPAWTEEMARYLFIYMVAFGCSVAVREKEFVCVDLLTSYFSKIVNTILSLIIDLGILGFSGYLLVKSVIPFANIKFRMVSTAMQIPMQYVYYSMIIMFGLLIISYIFEIILLITKQVD